MPTYEYVCKDCGYEFEEFQSIKADPLTICPKCNGQVIRKIGMGAGLVFKGSGFYITDYKNKKEAVTQKPNASKSDKKPAEDTKKTSLKNA